MKTSVLLVYGAVIVVQVFSESERRNDYLRNFYDDYETHARRTEDFLQNEMGGQHPLRHRKLTKIARCRRYAQLYRQNYGSGCYYQVCRQNYCGYCPTPSCRRRCPNKCPGNQQFTTTAQIAECKCDKDGSIFQACDSTGVCKCKPHYNGRRCEKCEYGYWKNSTNCAPCECNPQGSTEAACDQQTGSCSCKIGVQGLKCDSCHDKYYGNVSLGCKACDRCDKPGHICNPQNGKCVCPHLTLGSKCERCHESAWGLEPGIGCKACGCSKTGSATSRCDSITGRCTCRQGFEGEKCTKCSFGFFGYPNCLKCNCALAGTLQEDCSDKFCQCAREGCRCKANVDGRNCDRCKSGTFGLDPANPDGCINCFCFNRSTTCAASNNVWDQIRTTDLTQVESEECTRKCWRLPDKFRGDLVHSYGAHLRIFSNSPQSLVYLNGNGIVLEGVVDRTGDLKLVESSWRFKTSSNRLPIPRDCVDWLTRPCFMVVLQNVSRILIQPAPTQPVRIDEVVLEVATASTVEKCKCPPEYTSSSCQDPNNGYYRFYPKDVDTGYNYIDRIVGVAKSCECNNRSNVCDKQTGHCLNCTDNTFGPHCQYCAEGHFEDASGICSPCLCPSRNRNFAKSCTLVPRTKEHKCVCKEGYTGLKCDKCGDQFWGNPGQINGFCQQCNCNPFGSKHVMCDKITGACTCKSGFTGAKCSKCVNPRQVIKNGVCIYCDECTLKLFSVIDDMSVALNTTLGTFKNGLGPPWGLLNSTARRCNLLTKRYEDMDRISSIVQDANVPELEKRVGKIEEDLAREQEVINSQAKRIDEFKQQTHKLPSDLDKLRTRIEDIVKKIDKFSKAHVDVDEALREAREILQDISEISKSVPPRKYYQDQFDKCQKLEDKVNDFYGTNTTTDKIKSMLDDLKRRVDDFNLILDHTSHISELVKMKNEQNTLDFKNLNRTINEINTKDATIEMNLSDVVKKIGIIDGILTNVESIYRNLSAMNPEESTNLLSEDSVEPLYDTLSVAREFVKNLQRQVRTNENLFNFTADEWKKIDASSAYKNISTEIERAKEEAQEAKNVVVETVESLYPPGEDSLVDKTNLAKAFSDRIQKRVLNLGNPLDDFGSRIENLEGLKNDILVNGKNNNDLNSELRNMRTKIELQAMKLKELENVRRQASNVSSLIESIDRGIKNTNISVQYNLAKMYVKYLDLASTDDVENLKKNVDKTRALLQQIQLSDNLTKIDNIRNKNEQFFKNSKNRFDAIQQQISRLISNIRYANELVETVKYGVDVANCRRQYQLKNDIFRSLKINFKCKVCDLFHLTNSRKQQIHIRYDSDSVHILWNNQSYNIKGSDSIAIKRLGSTIEVKADENLTFDDSEPFQIESSHWLEIGKISQNNNSEACVRKITLNGKTLGLWRFKTSEGQCPGCFRNTSDDSLEDVFFHGDGYRKVLNESVKNQKPTNLNFKFYFATFDENSLIFLSQYKTNSCSFIALKLDGGRLQLQVRYDNGFHINRSTLKKYNKGINTIVEVSMNYNHRDIIQEYSFKVLSPDNETVAISKHDLPRKNVYKIRQSEIFVGGVSGNFNTSCLQFPVESFMGNLKVTTDKWKVTSDNTLSYHVEPTTGSLKYFKAWFKDGGFVNLEAALDTNSSLFPISFSLTPTTINDNFVMSINGFITVSIKNATLVLNINDKQELAFESVCANTTQLINITQNTVRVNNVVKNIMITPDRQTSKITLVLGKASRRSFTGSIGDIFVNNKYIFFDSSTVKDFNNVEIGRDYLSTLSARNECVKEMQNTERYSRIPEYKTEPEAFKFGDKSDSFIFVKDAHAGKKSVLEFQFRTFYPNGLLLFSNYLTLKNMTTYVVLEIQGGDVRVRVQGHKIKAMRVGNKVNDGLWHHVQIEQIVGKKKLRLVVKLDKKYKIKERLGKSAGVGLYIGGIASTHNFHKKLRNELHPFRGCIRALKINRNSLEVAKSNDVFYNNIGQCFQNVEEGAYFGGDAYAIYQYDFKISKYLELSFEFKTGELNGILLSISSARNSPALSVELQNGAVVMTIDMGNGVVSKVTNSPHADSSLADNEWHNITALYSSSELTVNIDGVRKSWVQSDMGSMVDEIEAPLYLGGLPNNVPSGTLKIKENFKGCIRKFKIEDNIMDWTDMKKLNNVQLNSCLS